MLQAAELRRSGLHQGQGDKMKQHESQLTPRRRVELALHKKLSSRVPFTVYDSMVPQCSAERAMRNRGLCILKRMGVFAAHSPNVKVRSEVYWQSGRQMTRTRYETPAGNLETLQEAADFTTWMHERMFKSPDDYKALLFLIKDEVYEPDYAAFADAEKDFGEDAIFRAGFGLEPLQALISGCYMDTATFCMEWMDRRDDILMLYDALVEKRRQVYALVAQSPAGHANYGGNVVPEIIGLKTFEEYYVPHYNEAADIMHRHGKLIGCHFDANCKLLAKAIAGTGLDYIEAFTPAPDTDMTLAEARAAWPDKVLWLNFPSSVHLRGDTEVRQVAMGLLDEAGRADGLIMGITENIPPRRWQGSCRAIMDGLEKHAAEHPGWYTPE